MADLDHFFQVRIFLLGQIKLIVNAAIVVLILMMFYWHLNWPEDMYAISTVGLVSLILSLTLGYTAYQSEVAHPAGMAFGIAWRLGAAWIIIAALAEAIITGETYLTGDAIATIGSFPILLVLLIGIIAGGFMLGYLTGALWSGVYAMSRQNLAALLLSFLGIIAPIGFAILRPPEDKQSAEQKQTEAIQELREAIKNLPQTELEEEDGDSAPGINQLLTFPVKSPVFSDQPGSGA